MLEPFFTENSQPRGDWSSSRLSTGGATHRSQNTEGDAQKRLLIFGRMIGSVYVDIQPTRGDVIYISLVDNMAEGCTSHQKRNINNKRQTPVTGQ